ncbi:MAG: peptidoglycan -binding protein [Rhodospirillaceae bacterium]|jgi:chemotaxis protein MotB|nr:peptidoglycan -binding protein [Rhodospirillaceae bacterium]MBT5033376.1 peptidoglycan -binding protein [Rhodospirillaceae bacterium]MBT6219220.1 peptidoglycan -binding protein [Rhodospirillaceae bacterium]MBT6363929.1 peptidoglycan -binding protein [Rhodospirillaceae bacterium]MBT7488088.1 peptidoglycan -binding protein [Rhodospirillales bacterium]
MPTLARRAQRSTNTWPGFVDALATLLMVIIFLLMIFVLAQFFLNEAITGKDSALDKLRGQVGELAELLALERKSNTDLRSNVAQLSTELQSSVNARDEMSAAIQALTVRAEGAETSVKDLKEKSAELSAKLENAFKSIEVDKEKIKVQLSELAQLTQSVAALQALKESLEKENKGLLGNVEDTETALLKEQELSKSARAQIALLTQQTAALRVQIAKISGLLDAAEKTAKEKNIQIVSLGKRLNAALATKVQELSQYRSEFFGKLRNLLGKQKDIRVVGDRFVFQSEVLFGSGSAKIGGAGETQLTQLATTLRDISKKIPAKINWVLRVDGHTDRIPIRTPKYSSNWELSSARAISVVKFLTAQGIPAERLAATGFGEHQPLDAREDEIAFRRNRRIELKLTQR